MNPQEALWLILSVLAIFSFIILFTRIFGLRTFAKMSSFDFASTIAIGSIIAAVIMNSDYSILKGAIALAAIIGFQTIFSLFVRNSKLFKKTFTNKPQILMWNGEVLEDQLSKCNVGYDDLIGKLREANVHSFDEVQAVIFESTGDVSVLHDKDNRKIDKQILKDLDIPV